MANKGLEYIHFIETHHINIATFRCDDAGEILNLKKNWFKLKNMNVEFSAPNTSQQNRIVERVFVML